MSAEKHTPETAGSLMLTPFTTREDTLAKNVLHPDGDENPPIADTYDYVYVLDHRDRLVGVLALAELFQAAEEKTVAELMATDIVSVSADTDQEHIALLALKHELKSIPVVDNDVLLGVVPSHRILQILHDEHVEDLLKEAGLVHKNFGTNSSVLRQVHGRLPWLLYGTVGGLLAAGIVQRFEGALAEQLLLAAFIPTIVYLADAVGNQVQTLYVRAYAFGLSQRLRSSVSRELLIAMIIGLVVSMLLATLAYAWFGSAELGLILFGSAFISIVFASTIAVILPWLFIRLGYDPAVSSGPLGTIILDISSIIIYFLVAEQILRYLSV